MRHLSGDKAEHYQHLKDVPKGVCKLCGGVGRFRTTFKKKAPIISSCWRCAGTGKVKIKVEYSGKMQEALWTGSNYEVLTESDDHYIIINRDKELQQVEKGNFKLIR